MRHLALLVSVVVVPLTAGDALFLPTEHGDVAGNAGDGPLVLSLANLHTAGGPMLTFMATPMP
jgi:oxalate decarboxylase/phosphoglucose isomerase-like protein (cupin superfamily)